MKKKFAAFSVLAAGTIFASPLLSPAYAETNQDKLSNIQSELEGKQSDLQNKSVEKEQIEKEIRSNSNIKLEMEQELKYLNDLFL